MQKGFTLLAALFMLILLSILGAAIIDRLYWSQGSVNYDLLKTRAKYAAQSGLALAKMNQAQTNQCIDFHTQFDQNYGTLSGFKVDVECVQQNGNTLIKVKASKGQFGQRDYVVYTQTIPYTD